MFTSIARFFGFDVEHRALANKCAHVVVEFEKASQKIKNAEAKFHKVRDNTVSDFQNLKRNTLDKTVDAVARLKNKIDVEEVRVDTAHSEAKDKIAVKRNAVDRLSDSVRVLDLTAHSL